jgi:hypothetical protein
MPSGSGYISNDVHEAWDRFLIEVTLAHEYPTFYLIDSAGLAGGRKLILEQLLPSLLYVKMVAILDEALVAFIDFHKLKLQKPYRKDMNGRISFLHDHGHLTRGTDLHRIRNRRNDIAHTDKAQANWPELTADTDIVHAELMYLKCVGAKPHYSVEGERSAAMKSKEPGIAFVQHYAVKVKNGEKLRAAIEWQRKFHSEQ